MPVATSLNGRGAIPERHPLALGVMGTYSRPSANRSVHEADFALFIGSGAARLGRRGLGAALLSSKPMFGG